MRDLDQYLDTGLRPSELGGAVEVTYSTTRDQRVGICRAQVRDCDAMPWVVSLSALNRWGPTLGGQQASADVLYAYATIQFGIASGLAEVEIDWRQGQLISVWGSVVQVGVYVPTEGAPPAAIQGQPMRFAASIIPGERSPVVPPTRTVPYGTIAGAAETIFPIPRFAYAVNVQRDYVASTDGWILNFYRGDGTVLLQTIPITNAAGRVVGDAARWTPVPSRATWLGIDNATANNMNDTIAIYQLAM